MTPTELVLACNNYIQSNPELRLAWAHATLEDKTLMLMEAAYAIGKGQ
jgi:hypothetical protein